MQKQKPPHSEKKPKKTKSDSLKKYAQLSGIGFQMGATIFLFSFGGKKLDQYYQTQKNWFTIGLTLLGVALSIYVLLKQLNQINKDE